jgi:hypothetical protein
LCRFVFSKSHIDSRSGRVTSAVFMPPRDLKLSVFRIKELSEQDVLEIGKKVGKVSDRKLVGHANLAVKEFEKRDLQIQADNKPIRHANVINWPDEKAQRLILAQELADIAKLSVVE